MPLWCYMENGGDRAVAVWHRRAGKDEIGLHWTAVAAHQRIGNYWHMLPTLRQGRKAVWSAINPHTGKQRIDEAFPVELRANKREDEMSITFKCGSTWQIVGSDSYNSLLGSPPVGIIFSEYAVAKPSAWDFLRPILAENGGWALFIFTPRGRNHGHQLYDMAKGNDRWFAQLLTVSDTNSISAATIKEERDSGMLEEMIEQEYFCSFEAALVGAYYGKLLADADRKGRIGSVEYDPSLPVNTAWDLGYHDDTIIWFFQLHAGEVRLIDYYAGYGHGVEHYCEVIASKGYRYDRHWVPWDAQPKTMAANGRSILQQAWTAGVKMTLAPNLDIQDGIQATRLMLPNCWFDAEKCRDGLEALRQYQREWDDDRKCFRDLPKHDWASHPADAFRYLALAYRERKQPTPTLPPRGVTEMTIDEAWKHAGPTRGSNPRI